MHVLQFRRRYQSEDQPTDDCSAYLYHQIRFKHIHVAGVLKILNKMEALNRKSNSRQLSTCHILE